MKVEGERVGAFLLAKNYGSNPHVHGYLIPEQDVFQIEDLATRKNNKIRKILYILHLKKYLIYLHKHTQLNHVSQSWKMWPTGAAEVCFRACLRIWHLQFLSLFLILLINVVILKVSERKEPQLNFLLERNSRIKRETLHKPSL